MLKRLFGIDARVSAGKTTKGINCCRVQLTDSSNNKNEKNNVDLVLVDTEGINSIETTTNKNSALNRKRNNKIMLGALASSSVFLLNIMKDATDAKLLDVILWAYEKLDLKSANSKLSNIKFIFVIRDVTEYSDTGSAWLKTQKARVTEYLNESIKLSPKYIDNENYQINSIEDLIGTPEYFAMPNAFDTNKAPNPQFSKRCVELREKILSHFSLTNSDSINTINGVNKNNCKDSTYKSSLQWSQNMIFIWRSIVRLENMLCVADFRDQQMIKILRKQVKSCLNKLRDRIAVKMDRLMHEGYHSCQDHSARCKNFSVLLARAVHRERNQLLESFDDNETLSALELSDEIINRYKEEFCNQVNIVIDERRKQFDYKSRALEALAIDNHIITLLNQLIHTLKNETLLNPDQIYPRYTEAINKIRRQYETKNSEEKIFRRIERRFNKAYIAEVLKPNEAQGKQPSTLNSLSINAGCKVLTAKDQQNGGHTNKEMIESRGESLQKQIKSKVKELAKSHITTGTSDESKESKLRSESDTDNEAYYHENWDDSHTWCQLFEELDYFMNLWDKENYTILKISEEYRCHAHGLLKQEIIKKVATMHSQKIKSDIKRIEEIRVEKFEAFQICVQTTSKDIDIARTVSKQLVSEIAFTTNGDIDSFIYNTIESNCRDQESKIFLKKAFDKAFDKRTGDAQQAMEFINYQARMMKKAYDEQLENLKENMLIKPQLSLKNKTFREHTQQSIQNKVNELCSLLDTMDETSGKLESNGSKQKLMTMTMKLIHGDVFSTLNVRQFLISKGFKINHKWFYGPINKCDTFVTGLKKELNKLKPNDILSDKAFKKQFQRSFVKNRIIFYQRLLGCMNFCPYCNAKCQCEYKHTGKCQTNNHFLLAFAGHYHFKTKKLRVNVCCSRSNSEEKWANQSLVRNKIINWGNKWYDFSKYFNVSESWDKQVKKHNEGKQWYPITNIDFDKRNVHLMLNSFFNKGLQNELLKTLNKNQIETQQLIAATKNDVECKDEVDMQQF